MNWLSKIVKIPQKDSLNISIPKDKLLKNIRNKFLQMELLREYENISRIVYHAIFRYTTDLPSTDELHVIEVELNEPKYIKTIGECLQQAIPYSQLVIFSSVGKHLLFRTSGSNVPIRQCQFSSWVYEEEILLAFEWGDNLCDITSADENNFKPWMELPPLLSQLFKRAAQQEYYSLRHLIDLLKIQELKSGIELVRPLLFQLISQDQLEFFFDTSFVAKSYANSAYASLTYAPMNPHGIEDKRFGIDRQFEQLCIEDFTTHAETRSLVQEMECLPPEYAWQQKEYNEWDTYCEDDYE